MSIRIAIDAMSGDMGPLATIPGSFNALLALPNNSVELILVGQAEGIRAAIPYHHPAISIVHADDAITMDELPGKALRHGKQSSMYKAVELVAKKEADVCVSSGNTGALMAISRHLLRTLPGIKRPAICAQFPSKNKPTYILDLGANIENNAELLLDYAKMGAALAESVSGKILPSIALLNVGVEKNKGHLSLQQAAQKIQEHGLNYQGFVEGNHLFDGEHDVIVSDGFSGNIALKASEGMANYAKYKTEKMLLDSYFFRIFTYFLEPLLDKYLKQISPQQYNGASILGLSKLVVKSHGNADATAFQQAVLLAYTGVEQGLIDKINQAFLDQ